MNKLKTRRYLVALFISCILCLSLSITAFAAMGYGSNYGYTGDFYIDVPEGGSTGRITVGIESPDQTQSVYFKITRVSDGAVIWNRSTLGNGVKPNNAAEILSPIYSNFQPGRYRVQYTSLVEIRFNCWIYNW